MDTSGPLAQYYACALKSANVVPDGYQRAMTEIEQQTTFLWSTGQLHLATVPKFFTETFVADELDVLVDYHKRHLLYRLYVRLPRGIMLPRFNANRDFWNLLQKGATEAGGERRQATIDALFADHYTTTCQAKFQMVTLTFTSPVVRNKWKNRTLPFMSRKIKVTLKASDTLSASDPHLGFDEGATALQYSILLLGLESKTQREVRAIARGVAKTQPLCIEELPPDGRAFAPHFWRLTYAQLSCPRELVDVRKINVCHGDEAYSVA
ncbi:hypothetical protein PINS_up011602 [Pythium insidiosum]|nr:hypothetical protein PINS_up011602 [Pythium insidiosum]